MVLESILSNRKKGAFYRGINTITARHEFGLLALILVGFLGVITMLSAQLWPVWMDEVLLTDPAANLFLGNGFTSSAWYYQTRDEVWACNAPLYALLLFPWLKVFGLQVATTRLLNYVLISLSMVLIWCAVYRLNLVSTTRDRFILIALILCSYGVSFTYLSGRYDCLAIALFSGLMLAYTFPSSLPRTAVFLGIGFLIPLAGFHLLPYGVILAALLFPFLGKPVLKAGIPIGVGMVLGLGATVFLYAQQGVLDTFIETLGGHTLGGLDVVPDSAKDAGVGQKMMFALTNLGPILVSRFAGIGEWYFQDGSFVLLMAGAIALASIQRINQTFYWRSPLGFGLLAGVVVPLLMGLVRNYPKYYGWMGIIPLVIGISAALVGVRGSALKKPGILWVAVLLIASSIPGLPNRLVPGLLHWQDRDYQRVEQFVQANIAADEVVYSDFAPYYAIRKRVDTVLFPSYLDVMSDEDKQQLTTLLLELTQEHKNYQDINLFEQIGGGWYETNARLDTSQFQLRIFKRKAA
ncbi:MULTISPECIES: hypothetical protein [unclassified Leptolyngbya]|uniref:hypothetical protein n=1 Tax=unclassified Leptolyngbya TaxID=2650499 RepID=UPI001683B04A|nr:MULTISPECIES: hypothetical protein [unclassified Leptolyngbya]MBD1912506.1 hypothetical protein [Leptolyngbya sp. FACHB-8]MBD2156483.1 hypothetical protein [Leptolyngbya sp. FACHB-16]